ncbi:cytochrome c biogenesis protein CcdA, partial [Rhizobium ruizarguesonis]
MSIADISLWSALIAGALSFLSPCVLPLVDEQPANMVHVHVGEDHI